MRKITGISLVVVVLGHVFAAPVAVAQTPTMTAARVAPSSCPYDLCALRVEPGFLGGRTLVVGVDGVRTNFGFQAGGLVRAVDRVPAALAEAQLGRRNAIVSNVFAALAGIALVVALDGVTYPNSDKRGNGQAFGALLTGGAIALVGGVQRVYAERHYSRAIWLYNAALPK